MEQNSVLFPQIPTHFDYKRESKTAENIKKPIPNPSSGNNFIPYGNTIIQSREPQGYSLPKENPKPPVFKEKNSFSVPKAKANPVPKPKNNKVEQKKEFKQTPKKPFENTSKTDTSFCLVENVLNKKTFPIKQGIYNIIRRGNTPGLSFSIDISKNKN